MNRLKFLILEDAATDAELMERELRKDGLEFSSKRVETKEDFEKGLKEFKPDLILADYKLPGFDGLSALKIAKKRYPDIPFIFVSGTIGEELAVEALKRGATDYVIKSKLFKLPSEVHRALKDSEARRKRKQAELELKQSYEKLKNTFEGAIQAIALAIDKRDPYTAGHQQRVTKLACAIAQEMSLPENKIEGIRMAGMVHDIGKIYVPAEILSKPAKLTEAEMAIIKDHPQVGYDILKNIEFPWPVAEIVLQHHERMLGDGYPVGLAGEEILKEARIIAVADVVEAMSSHRPYRPALGIKAALEEIKRWRGHHYDPEVVDACLKVFEEKGFRF
jgi:putative two-component system response regulator